MSHLSTRVADDSSEDDVEPLLTATDLDNDDAVETSASATSAFNIQALRERTHMPYSGTNVVRQRNITAETVEPIPALTTGPSSASLSTAITSATTGTAASKPSHKGKERAADQDDVEPDIMEIKETTAAALPTESSPFTCHICLEIPASDDCVVTRCGHFFCWSDLSNWLDSNPPKTSACPVCKSQIKDIQQDVFPIYSGSGNGNKQIDPRTKPRPKPHVTPAPQPASQHRGTSLFGTPLFDSGGWTMQAGVFPFPGLSMGWSNQNAARMHATRFGLDPMQSMHDMTPEQRAAAQEQARIQQRNALIAFVVMIVLFSLMATIGDMDSIDYIW